MKTPEEIVKDLRESCTDDEFTPPMVTNTELTAAAAWNRRAGNDINVVTNVDRIRSLTDRELAEYIFALGNDSEYCYGHCAYQDDCIKNENEDSTCLDGVLAWLHQPADEDTNA